jgi:BirA family biotin operon repressor/biotin-[acetyl-CoA-carboxylase] ligase
VTEPASNARMASAPDPDALDPSAVSRATGWTVHALEETDSTNDEAARLRHAGAGPRTVVVAARQRAGRGRAGRRFASPPGGLYASALLEGAPEDLPGPLTAAVALALVRAVERFVEGTVRIKWPNDLWVGGRKAGGILLEASGPAHPVVAGVGVNLRAVPEGIEAAFVPATCLDAHASAPVPRETLLADLLRALDRALAALHDPGGREALARDWTSRAALVGERVAWVEGGRSREGHLEAVDLARGLLLREGGGPGTWRRGEHLSDLRPAGAESGP